jgi:hypothetical protein
MMKERERERDGVCVCVFVRALARDEATGKFSFGICTPLAAFANGPYEKIVLFLTRFGQKKRNISKNVTVLIKKTILNWLEM